MNADQHPITFYIICLSVSNPNTTIKRIQYKQDKE